VRAEGRAARHRPPRLGFGGAHTLGQTVCGRVESAEDALAVQQRVQVHAFGGAQQPPVDSPRRGPAGLAMQISPAFLGGGDLEPSDGIEGPAIGVFEGAELLDGVARKCAHGLGRVGLEHQTRCVRCRSAGREQRPAVEHGDVGEAAGGQLIGK
jgi:hypothetical protein